MAEPIGHRQRQGAGTLDSLPIGYSIMPTPTPASLLAELRRQGIVDERVLAAIAAVPREAFVGEAERPMAWANVALPIGEGQTISQPYVVAIMAQALSPQPDERVLEIGAGSGYGAAVLAQLARQVVAVERLPALAEVARARLVALGYTTIEINVGDGTLGWPAGSPYDAISVAAAAPTVPPALLAQLHPTRGRMVIPVGDHEGQALLLVQTDPRGPQPRSLGSVRFVPLIGRQGWIGSGER
jgi:protein-L-isoaspartate(D-aspartate) O-methyltransferase